MPNMSGPYLVRDESVVTEPGAHSYSALRRTAQSERPSGSGLSRLRRLLFVLGVLALGYYAYVAGNQYVYQAYENWSFDQQIAGRSGVTFADYLREQTYLGFLAGSSEKSSSETNAVATKQPEPTRPLVPHGSVLGRLSIARLGISAIVREGVDTGTLSKAVGHVPSTALPGGLGNFSIAAHRDTLFRALRDVRIGDQVDFQSTSGTYSYRVISTQIVKPSDVSVLRADGGPKLLQKISDRPSKLLTMITCYPFNYIGSAPERFIVQAEAIETPPPVRVQNIRSRPVKTHVAVNRQRPALPQSQAQSKPKKRGFWHRLFHLG